MTQIPRMGARLIRQGVRVIRVILRLRDSDDFHPPTITPNDKELGHGI